MAVSTASGAWNWSELVIDFLLRLVLIAGLAALSVWLWPDGIFDMPLASIKLGDWLWAAAALWMGMLCLLAFYFVVVQPLIALRKEEDSD
jgi:hypothetical protein